jgi:YVTN family beta-propeller protein
MRKREFHRTQTSFSSSGRQLRLFASALLAAVVFSFQPAAASAQDQLPSATLISNRAIAINPVIGKVYAVDERNGSIAIIDMETNSSSKVKVGAGPEAVAINTITGRVYVANSADGTISVLDGRNNTLVATVKGEPHPYVLAVNEATNKVYVSNTYSDKATVIDGETNIASTIKLGSADNIVIDPKNNRIFLLGYEDPNLTILNGTTGSLQKSFLGTHIWGMAWNEETGAVYVTRIENSEVVVLQPDLRHQATIPTGAMPCAVAVNSKTNAIYVANYADSTVTVIDGKKQVAIATIKVGNLPEAVSVDAEANLVYVANTHGNSVSVIDGNTNAVIATLEAGQNPFALASGRNGRKLYVANFGQPSFTVLDLRPVFATRQYAMSEK